MVKLPCGPQGACQNVLATVHINCNESYRLVEDTEPPAPNVDCDDPIVICCPLVCAIDHPEELLPRTIIVSPGILVAGNVKVQSPPE